MPNQQPATDTDDQQPSDRTQPGRDLLHGQPLLRHEQTQTEQSHYRDVCHGDDEPEEQCVSRCPPLTDQIGGGHRLAVSGGQRVQGAKKQGQEPCPEGGSVIPTQVDCRHLVRIRVA